MSPKGEELKFYFGSLIRQKKVWRQLILMKKCSSQQLIYQIPTHLKLYPTFLKTTPDRKRLELAREISDKLAHGIYRTARKLINRYKDQYGLETVLNDTPLLGWKIHAEGHLIDDNGKHIDTVIDSLKSTNKNLIVEEFDVFVHNNYHLAAEEIFESAWTRILANEKSLASMSEKLHMLRGFKRGEKTYIEE